MFLGVHLGIGKVLSVSNKVQDACASAPCFPFVKCISISTAPGFQCGSCPPGLSGNGINCTDIDEVSRILIACFGIITPQRDYVCK